MQQRVHLLVLVSFDVLVQPVVLTRDITDMILEIRQKETFLDQLLHHFVSGTEESFQKTANDLVWAVFKLMLFR